MSLLKNRTVIYKFRFEGIDAPIEIETDKGQTHARFELLPREIERRPEYRDKKIVGQTSYTPITNVTKKIVNGSTFIWVGKEHSQTGWVMK